MLFTVLTLAWPIFPTHLELNSKENRAKTDRDEEQKSFKSWKTGLLAVGFFREKMGKEGFAFTLSWFISTIQSTQNTSWLS